MDSLLIFGAFITLFGFYGWAARDELRAWNRAFLAACEEMEAQRRGA